MRESETAELLTTRAAVKPMGKEKEDIWKERDQGVGLWERTTEKGPATGYPGGI